MSGNVAEKKIVTRTDGSIIMNERHILNEIKKFRL